MKTKMPNFLIAIFILIIIIGLIVIATKGLVFNLDYSASKSVELNLGKTFEEKDIKEITDEVFEKQKVKIESVEIFKDEVKISTNEITDDQKSALITKINEKYGTELKAEDIEISENSNVRGRDIVKPYIVPFIVMTIFILLYQGIRFRKLNSLMVIAKSFLVIVMAELLAVSVIAICRIPVGYYIDSLIIFLYVMSLLYINTKFENEI